MTPAHAARPTSRRPAVLAAALLGVVVSLFHGLVGCRLYSNYRSGMDLAIFDQAIRNLSRFHLPISNMKAPGMNLWGDHFHPVLVLAAPAYWFWDDPRVLLLVQGVCIGTSSALVAAEAAHWIAGRRGVWLGVVLGLGLALSPGVQFGAVFDFHEVALGMPLLAMACRHLLCRNWTPMALWSATLLLVKEDMGALVVGLAVVAFLKGARRLGIGLAVLAVAWTLLVVKVVIPAISPSGTWLYADALPGVGTQLANLWRAFVDGGRLTHSLLILLLATGFLALRSLLPLALLPMMLSRAVTGNQSYWEVFNHYNLLPCVVLAFAAVEGIIRIRRKDLAALVVVAVAGYNLGTGPSIQQLDDRPTPARLAAAQQAMAQVPVGASVAADAYLTPHLTHTHPLTQQVRTAAHGDPMVFRDDLGGQLVARYRIIDLKTHATESVPGWAPRALAFMRGQGCRQISQREGYVVLDCG